MINKKKTLRPKQEELIHIRIGHEEAIERKRTLLSSQINILNLAKQIQSYKKIRLEEFKKKQEIFKKTKQIKINITKLKKLLPKYENQETSRISNEEIEQETKEIQKVKPKNTIELQLEEIQNKLKSLQR